MLHIDKPAIKPFYGNTLFLKNPQIGIVNVHTHSNGKHWRVVSPSLIQKLLFECLVEIVGIIGHIKWNNFGIAFSIICVEQSSSDTNTSNRLFVVYCNVGPIRQCFILGTLFQFLTSPGRVATKIISKRITDFIHLLQSDSFILKLLICHKVVFRISVTWRWTTFHLLASHRHHLHVWWYVILLVKITFIFCPDSLWLIFHHKIHFIQKVFFQTQCIGKLPDRQLFIEVDSWEKWLSYSHVVIV